METERDQDKKAFVPENNNENIDGYILMMLKMKVKGYDWIFSIWFYLMDVVYGVSIIHQMCETNCFDEFCARILKKVW